MKSTPVLGFVPWAKIHQPLPRTPRQSQQLLEALTSSFRRQLDQEHPSSSPPPEQNNNGNPAVNPNSSVHATDKHMRSILDNPLFRVVPSISTKAPAKEIKFATDPMLVFDDMVASGSVTTAKIERCLQMQLLLASRNPENALEVMKKSQAGSKVTAWWFASGSRQRRMLLSSSQARKSLVKFMVVEGLQDSIIVWLDLLAKGDIGGDNGLVPVHIAPAIYKSLLAELIYAEVEYGGGLPTSVQHYFQATRNLVASTKIPISNMLPTGSHALHSRISRGPHEISSAAYDELLYILSRFLPLDSSTAALPLYHPTRPNPTPYLEYMKGLDPDTRMKLAKARPVVQSGFDAIRMLMDQDRPQDAYDLAQSMQPMVFVPGPEYQQMVAKHPSKTTDEQRNILANLIAQADLSLT